MKMSMIAACLILLHSSALSYFRFVCSLRYRACSISLVESIPENLPYPVGSPSHMSTFDAWLELLHSAEETVDIASFYWTLLANDSGSDDPSNWQVRTMSLLTPLLSSWVFIWLIVYDRWSLFSTLDLCRQTPEKNHNLWFWCAVAQPSKGN